VPTAFHVPACCRNRVYFFLVGDFHPCHDLESLRSQLIDAGYIKVYCGKRGHLSYFTSELKKIHCAEPEARFVIVSQGSVAPTARRLAACAGEASIPIDLFVYVDDVKELQPVLAQKVIAIHGEKADATGAGAEVDYVLADAGLKGVAGHPQTLAVMLRYLEPVSARVPLVEHVDPAFVENSWPASDDAGVVLQPDGADVEACGGLPILLAPDALPASMGDPERQQPQ
jgi:hypothetical protein